MPKDAEGSDLESVLDHLDDFALDTQNYQTIQTALEKSDRNIKMSVIEKLLRICARDLKEEMKNKVNALNVVATVLKKKHAEELQEMPDLIPSAIAVLHIIKTTAPLNKVDGLKMLCFEILHLYPNDVLISLAVSHCTGIMEMINLYFCQRIPLEVKLQVMNIIFKILKMLPSDKRNFFVMEDVDLWFIKMIPTVMTFMTSNIKNTIPLEVLEILTEEIVTIDYANNPNWHVVLECIYTPQKYPAVMKNLLDAGSDLWHRLWIIFIKLLKNQITRNTSSVGSPINFMLPVVEAAFKMNVNNRCRAFQCWNVLIDNFSTETNDFYINKRLKLLIIPLASNNAKVEETALAKLDTWWHLITQFESKINNCPEMVLFPFLNFCFGKPAVPERPVFAPGLLTINTKRQVLQAFANIAGHIHCECTVNMAKLKSKMLNSTLLVDHWRNWMHALTMTIRICVSDNSDLARQHFKCTWKSFIATITEISDINVRHNLSIEMLTILEVLLQSPQCDNIAELVFIILTNSVLNHSEKVQPLFKAEEVNAIHKIISLILHPSLDNLFTRYGYMEIVNNMMPLTNLLAEKYLKVVMDGYLKEPLTKINSVILWTGLSLSICELKCNPSEEILHNMLLLPLKSITLFTSVEGSTAAWISLYKHARVRFKGSSDLDKVVNGMISDHTMSSIPKKNFIFQASLALLDDNNITSENEDLICKIADILEYITCESDCSLLENDYPLFVNTLILLLNNVININNNNLATRTVLIVKKLFKIVHNYYEEKKSDQILNYVMKIVSLLDSLFRKDIYSTLKSMVVDELKKIIPYLNIQDNKQILEIVNDIVTENKNGSEIAIVNSKFSSDSAKLNNKDSDDIYKFSTPITIDLPITTKKNDSEILDTVVENGEEYVVVKSNWKFNPKKLTDNQKEKLQRTREDIPALYQDLSQSQDEFKKVFTVSSVDSTTTSKSITTENEDASSILKNMLPSNNVVSRIIDNIITDSTIKEKSDKTNPASIATNSNDEQKLLDCKSPKSPRIALKDRIFKNVKNLIEKSSLKKEAVELKPIEHCNSPSTPPTKQQNNNKLVYSAPPEINSARPARQIRKPKKFEDLKPLCCKRRRNSINLNNTPKLNIDNSESQEACLLNIKVNLVNDNVGNPGKVKDETVDNNKSDDCVIQNINKKECQEQNEYSEIRERNASCFQKNVKEERINTDDLKEIDNNINIDPSLGSQALGNLLNLESCNLSDDINLAIPSNSNTEEITPKSSTKKSGKRKSRIEKELAIDMVEGHPFLKLQSDKRLTRKTVVDTSLSSVKRKTVLEKLSKSKNDNIESQPEKKCMDKKLRMSSNEKQSNSLEDSTSSQFQDIIESSQDSAVSTLSSLSVKATKKYKKISHVTPNSLKEMPKENLHQVLQLDILNDTEFKNKTGLDQNIDDIELSRNKTVIEDSVGIDFTEEMDTQPAENNISSDEVKEIKDDDITIVINTDDTYLESDIANADTQNLDTKFLFKESSLCNVHPVSGRPSVILENTCKGGRETPIITMLSLDTNITNDPTGITKIQDVESDCSPFKDEAQRKQDFMNNTLEISPIKTLSPVQEEKKNPSPESSSDFVVITLSSPVHSNGEPFDKSNSPEIFTNDKISPDKRDQSPPRNEMIPNNSSPRSSLSLKKNRPPAARSSGRAAQMLVLCAPDSLPTINNQEKSAEPEDIKKSIVTNTSARRNLRILYNSTNETNDTCDENDMDSEYFLKLKRSLPTAESSPSGPILKRKLTDIIDDTTVSPASKRKRVSFHDPPVSTTICVKKYIEPSGIRSPQNSAGKRQERQLRSQVNMKSQKRLDNRFKLEKMLKKTVESFVNNDNSIANEDIEMSSPETTPVVEVIKTSDLNDTNLICAALVNCKDPIDNITEELSSPAMKLLLIKEFEGTVETIGDLAKMTELEVNRLCIKSPKVQVARKLLTDYGLKKGILNENVDEVHGKEMTNPKFDGEIIDLVTEYNKAMQTEVVSLTLASTQTDSLQISNVATQTTEKEEKATSSLISSSLLMTPDFVSQLCNHLDDSSKQEIAKSMSLSAITDMLTTRLDTSDTLDTISSLLDHHSKCISSKKDSNTHLSVIQNYLCDRFDTKDLILFCSDILRKVYETPM